MIKAVIFDVDGVLLDSFEANLKFFQDLMTYTGHKPPTRGEFPAMFHLTMKDMIKKITGIDDLKEIMRIFKIGESREIDYPLHLLQTPQGMNKAIERLHKDHLLGIVTSRTRNGVYEAPQLAELKKYFKVTVSYEDTENHKPHPEPLFFAAKKLGIEPHEAIYIGDMKSDIMAARAAGMKAILFAKEKFSEPDAHTSNFEEIPELVKELFK